MNEERSLDNRRCFVLKRCSTTAQADTSLHNQDGDIDMLVGQHQMTVVGQRDLAGVTGSVPGARDDIDEIIRLKRSGANFDLLILANTDRFTRAGQLHANKILWDLEGEGIEVYFVAEKLWSSDRLHRTILSFLFDAAQQTAISISRGATLGVTNSYLEGRSPHTRRPPYGMDRMYSVDGRDLHILRNLADGTQQMLDATTRQIIRTFGKNPQKGTPAHYLKQKNERVRLIAGDPQRVAVVTLICQAIHVERRSAHSVAKELNDTGIRSPNGKAWNSIFVKKIAFNPVYIGLLIRGRTSCAIYYMAAKGSPTPAKAQVRELRDRKRPQLRQRPYEQWLIREDPALAEYLPEPIRSAARRAIEADLQRQAAAKPKPAASKDRHRQSSFFLKNVLRSKQGNNPMSGTISGRNGEYRYYSVSGAAAKPQTGNLMTRLIPAEALEQAVLNVLCEVLSARGDLEQSIRQVLQGMLQRSDSAADRESIERQILRKQKQIAASNESLTGDDAFDQPITEKLSAYRAEVARLTVVLGALPQKQEPINVESIVAQLTEELSSFAEHLDRQQDNDLVREMIGLLVGRLEVDLLTRETELELRLPSWLADAIGQVGMMSLDQLFAWKMPNETHQGDSIILAEYRCQEAQRKPLCLKCQRVRRAA